MTYIVTERKHNSDQALPAGVADTPPSGSDLAQKVFTTPSGTQEEDPFSD